MALEEPKDNEEIISVDNYKFTVEEDLKEMYRQFTVDYSDSWLRKGFTVYPDGSNASGDC